MQITVAEGQSSHDVAQHIIGQARGTTAAGEDTTSQSESQSPAPESKSRQEFQRFAEVRSPLGNKGTRRLREKDLTALDRAKAYLSGLRAADAAEFRRAFVEIATNIHEAQTV